MRQVLITALVLVALSWASQVGADKSDFPPKGSAPEGKYNKSVLAFCQSHLGKKVGSGECAHLAIEALRVAGAEFITTNDRPEPGDYVWGSLVKVIAWKDGKAVDANPKNDCQPGDIVQYRDTLFKNARAEHHTSIVGAVDAQGYPTQIYQQNLGPKMRFVENSKIDFRSLLGGWVRIYRPMKPTPNPKAPLMFTLLNTTSETVSYQLFKKDFSLPPYDTPTGFTIWQCSKGVKLVLGGVSYPLRPRAGYAIYKKSDDSLALREVK